MKNKIFSLLMTLVLCTSIFAGCSGNDNEENLEASSEISSEEDTETSSYISNEDSENILIKAQLVNEGGVKKGDTYTNEYIIYYSGDYKFQTTGAYETNAEGTLTDEEFNIILNVVDGINNGDYEASDEIINVWNITTYDGDNAIESIYIDTENIKEFAELANAHMIK